MSADSDEKRPRRRPLSRSRKLGSRRRRGRGGDDDDENEEEGSDDSESGDDSEASPEAADDPPDQTMPVARIPGPAGQGSGTPNLDAVSGPPAGERWAKASGAARRFGLDFSKFLVGLGHSAQERGTALNERVVKPVSHALFEAAICLALIFICGVFGVTFGRYLKRVTADRGQTVTFQNREVRPGQQMDQSVFSTGFDTAELHQGANRVLDDYLRAIQSSRLVDAYNLLSPSWKAELSYSTFEKGYLNTEVIAYEIGKVETLDPQRIRLRADVKTRENGREKLNSAVYVAILTSDGWRLDGGTYTSR